jgi:hypothetical protein
VPKLCSRWPGTTALDQTTETTDSDSESFTADAVDEDCDSDMSPSTNPRIQRSTGDPEKGLGVAPFIERNLDKMESTVEWRGRVLHSREATQASTCSGPSGQQHHTPAEYELASLDVEIEQIRQHYREQEGILNREIVKHKKRRKRAMKRLKKEEKDQKHYPADCDWWGGVRSDYQPTECGDDGNR